MNDVKSLLLTFISKQTHMLGYLVARRIERGGFFRGDSSLRIWLFPCTEYYPKWLTSAHASTVVEEQYLRCHTRANWQNPCCSTKGYKCRAFLPLRNVSINNSLYHDHRFSFRRLWLHRLTHCAAAHQERLYRRRFRQITGKR